MRFKVVGTFKSALTRQVAKAVQIRGRSSSALNSKGEYDRCRIHRPTIGNEEIQQQFNNTTPLEGLEKNRDKLGLNWAKLRSNWNWALIQLRFN